MSVSDFFNYLLGREGTRDLALQLVYVYEGCRSRTGSAQEAR